MSRPEREAIECPQCHAAPGEPCRNYKGQRCAPHSARKPQAPAATPAVDAADLPRPSRPVAHLAPRIVPDDAVRSAEELIRKWGAGGAVNALAQALATCTLDVADGTRVLQMRRAAQ
jgi:hypothetical protein